MLLLRTEMTIQKLTLFSSVIDPDYVVDLRRISFVRPQSRRTFLI